VYALAAAWRVHPPASLSLRRIAAALGLGQPDPKPVAATEHDAMQEALAAGLPVTYGRPDDPMLAFLDLPTP